VDIHIAKLRRKIEADPKEPASLITVRGAGYRLLTAD
jgi:two-component system response regulator RegX3